MLLRVMLLLPIMTLLSSTAFAQSGVINNNHVHLGNIDKIEVGTTWYTLEDPDGDWDDNILFWQGEGTNVTLTLNEQGLVTDIQGSLPN